MTSWTRDRSSIDVDSSRFDEICSFSIEKWFCRSNSEGNELFFAPRNDTFCPWWSVRTAYQEGIGKTLQLLESSQSSERTMCFGKACGHEGIEYLVRMQGSQWGMPCKAEQVPGKAGACKLWAAWWWFSKFQQLTSSVEWHIRSHKPKLLY